MALAAASQRTRLEISLPRRKSNKLEETLANVTTSRYNTARAKRGRLNSQSAMKVGFSLTRRMTIYSVGLLLIGLWITGRPALIEHVRPNSHDVGLVGGPMVQLGNTDGKTALAIVWRTAGPATSRVDYGPTANLGATVTDPRLKNYHALVLQPLQPATRYHYRIISTHRVLAEATFQTGKTADQAFRFAVFGDSGSGKTRQYEVAREIERHEVDLLLHTGDVVYFKGEDEFYQEKFYLPYKKLLERVPIFPVLGNHDYETTSGQPWIDNFFLPGEERFYSFDYGNAHFVALDTSRVNAASAAWLERDLRNTNKLWKFVLFHEPPFSNRRGRMGSPGARNLWVPLFVKFKVDLVFSGHDHMYTRFKPRQGVNYIVEGLGGYSIEESKEDAGHVAFTDNREFGFGLVDVAGPELIFRHITATAKVLDTLRLRKQPQRASPAG